MSTVLLLSVSGSPGITTAAVAMTRNWDRPCILLEADTSKSSAVLSGYLQGKYSAQKSLINLALAASSQGHIANNHLWAQLYPLDTDNPNEASQWVLPGLMDPKGAPSLDRLWGEIMAAAESFDAAGTDVIIDAGRWALGDRRTALLRSADAVLLTARPSLSDAFAIRSRLEDITGSLAAVGHPKHLSLLSLDRPASTYGSDDLARSLKLRLAGSLPWDDATAAVFSDGHPVLNAKRLEKRPYLKSIRSLNASLRNELDDRRALLNESINTELEELS